MISTSNVKTVVVVLQVLLPIAGISLAQTPVFDGYPRSKYITVSESFPVGGLLFNFTVSHPTSDVSVLAQGYYATTLVKISQTQGKSIHVNVTTRVVLDRDGNGQPGKSPVSLEFVARDIFYNEIVLTIQLYITDENDNAPVFQNWPYIWEIPELPCNLSWNIYTDINATDLDAGDFGIIRYRMEPDQSTKMYKDTFSINNQSGYITMNNCVDYEEHSSYRYTVFAEDNLGSGNNSTAPLIIKVIDMQDQPPLFKRLFYRTVLKTEDTKPGASVITVNAFDGDRENSNQVEYSLQSGGCSKYFSIDKDSGQVSVQHAFNITSEGILNSLCTIAVQATEKGEHFPQYGNTSASTTVDIYLQESSTTQAPTSQPEPVAKAMLTPQFVSVVENSSQTLTCSYDGIKYVDVFRWQVDNVTIGDISATECRVLGSLNSSLYSYNCSSKYNYSVSLTILRLTRFNHGNIWQCIIILRGKTDMSNTVSVDVAVPITSVQMQEPASDSITVRENTQIIFVCVTSGGLPEAQIKWFKDDRILSVGDGETITSRTNVTSIGVLNSDKLKTIISTLQYSPTRSDNNMTIYCTANNSVNTVVSQRKPVLNVEYAPDRPPVILEGSSVHVIENTTQQLTCSITGGNPLPNITWSCYNGSVSDNSTGATVTKVVNWTTSRLQDGYCTCISSHLSGIMSDNISIVVLYPPTIPIFRVRNSTVYDTVRAIRNSHVSLGCVSDGNPAPIYTWTNMNSIILSQDLLLLAKIQTPGQYACNAENTMVPSKGSALTGRQSSSVSVEILYAPEVQPFENINIVEGQNLSVLCSIKPGNPSSTTFAWTRTRDNMTWQTQVLTIPYVTIYDASNYTCSANNTMSPTAEQEVIGIDSESFKLDVLYSYSVTMFTLNGLEDDVVVSENNTIYVKCDVEGTTGSSITIQHDNKTIVTSGVTHLDYSLTQAKCTDTGSYTCSGINEFNMQYAQRIIRLFVECSPRPSPFDPVIETVSSGLHKSVTFNFTALAYPEPTASQVQWYRLENHIMVPIEHNLNTEVTNDGLHYSLTIAIVTKSSFGDYFLRIANVFGSWEQHFYLEACDIPSVPTYFEILYIHETYVAVQWTPGFNGGRQQTFVLQYRMTGTHIWTTVAISHHGEPKITYMINQLSSGTQYELVLFAYNQIGRSMKSFNLTVTTDVEPSPSQVNGAVIGAVFGGVFGSAILVVFCVILICYIRRKRKGNDASQIDPNNRAALYMDLQNSQHEYTNTSPEYSELNTTSTRPDGMFVNSGPHLYTDVRSENSGAEDPVYHTINPS